MNILSKTLCRGEVSGRHDLGRHSWDPLLSEGKNISNINYIQSGKYITNRISLTMNIKRGIYNYIANIQKFKELENNIKIFEISISYLDRTCVVGS